MAPKWHYRYTDFREYVDKSARISTYISRRDHARLTAKLQDRGLSMAEYLRRLVEADLAGRHDYMLRLLGHRLSLMSVQVGALARRKFDDAEYQRLRSMGAPAI